MQLITAGGDTARLAFSAMMEMRKIDIATLEQAVAGAAK
jgi:predicted 3-demethylubiquinone-9 3-methyltransferase (glyoxalase superfamily)